MNEDKEKKNEESMKDKIDELKREVPKKDIPLGIPQKL